MQNNDRQVGTPFVEYSNTKSAIEALSGISVGATAFATDTNQYGYRGNAGWQWINPTGTTSGGGGHTIQRNGTPLTDRASLNFVGPGYIVYDDSGNDATIVSGTVYNDYPCQGRLSLDTSAVSTSTLANMTSVFFNPYMGNRIALFSGSSWGIFPFSSTSLSLVLTSANTNYDVFCYLNGSSPALELAGWGDGGTRGFSLTTQDGVVVKSGATTRRYLGTIRTHTAGQCADTLTRRFVWNYYNRVRRQMVVINTSSHNYSGTARKWNNSDTNNLLEYVTGFDIDASHYSYRGAITAGANGSYALIAHYVDGVEIDSAYRIGNYNANQIMSGVSYDQSYNNIGYHTVQLYELGNHASSNFANMMLNMVVWC
jgi:hypothetical protein